MDRSVVAPMRFHMSRQVPSRWCSTMCSKPRKYSLTKMRRLFFVQTTTAYIVLPNYCAAWIQIKIINAQHNRHFIMPCYNNVEHIYNFIYVYIYIYTILGPRRIWKMLKCDLHHVRVTMNPDRFHIFSYRFTTLFLLHPVCRFSWMNLGSGTIYIYIYLYI